MVNIYVVYLQREETFKCMNCHSKESNRHRDLNFYCTVARALGGEDRPVQLQKLTDSTFETNEVMDKCIWQDGVTNPYDRFVSDGAIVDTIPLWRPTGWLACLVSWWFTSRDMTTSKERSLGRSAAQCLSRLNSTSPSMSQRTSSCRNQSWKGW